MRRVYAGLFWALLGCDPTAGFADSADAAVPTEKRYFDGRGSRLSEGPWNRVVVDLDLDTLYHLGARRLDDEEPTFHLFGQDARDGCSVSPNSGTWLMGKPRQAPFRVLPFMESMDERGRGRLRFTGLDCAVQELVIEDAGRPSSRLYDHGYLVPTKRGYTFADPWRGEQREIAAELHRILASDLAVLLHADGTLKSFSEQFEPGQEWGNATEVAIAFGAEFLAEDADGIHRVRFDRESLAIEHTEVLPGACRLQRSSLFAYDDGGGWVAVQIPCDNPNPTLLRLDLATFDTLDSLELPFEADARYLRAVTSVTLDGEPAPLAALYLTDVDASLGTLWAWRADRDAPFQLGERAELDSSDLGPDTQARLGTGSEAPGGAWDGSAQVNCQELGAYRVCDWIRFRWDGTLGMVAGQVLRGSWIGETLVNFDGTTGDLPRFEGDGYSVLARGIAPSAVPLASLIGAELFARVDQFDGSSGRLRLGTDPWDPSTWRDLASRAPPELVRFSSFMPALVFLEDWDPDTSTGSLTAYNYELDARTTIAEGVSAFDLARYPLEGVVYAVPRGKQQGLWFSKAK